MSESKLLLEAIALKRCIAATYNRMALKLAPHILYTKHGDLFIDAVTVTRDGNPPREPKLGTFKLTGLRELGVTPDPFEPRRDFDPTDAKYEGALFAVTNG